VEFRSAEFFRADKPYWSAYYNEFVSPGRFLKLHLPAAFLLETLRNCTENYKRRLKAARKLPAELFFEFCSALEDLEYLDEDSIPKGKDLGFAGLVLLCYFNCKAEIIRRHPVYSIAQCLCAFVRA
jgi:hypothetical protein